MLVAEAELGERILQTGSPLYRRAFAKYLRRGNTDTMTAEERAAIAVVGTLASATIALLIAVPLSFGVALFLTETCPVWLRRPLGTAVELLAAVPSIIYGMFGLFIFAPLFAEHGQPALQSTLGQMPLIGTFFGGAMNGIGILAAGLVLAPILFLLVNSFQLAAPGQTPMWGLRAWQAALGNALNATSDAASRLPPPDPPPLESAMTPASRRPCLALFAAVAALAPRSCSLPWVTSWPRNPRISVRIRSSVT